MIRRIVLHIGGEKTGSTSIQAMMAMNRAALLTAGFAVPRAPGAANHIGLAAFAGAPALVPDLVAAMGGAAAVADLPMALAAEVAALPPHVHTLLLSSEHCQSRLHDPAALARLRDGLLAPLGAPSVEVLVWLRRQDAIARSLRNTWLRSHGASPTSDFPQDEASLVLMDHARTLARWAAGFGRDALRPRIFAPGDFAGGSLLRDWAAACGVPAEIVLRMPPPLNRSLSAAAEALLAAIPAAGIDRRPLFAWLEQRHPGQGRRPARAAVSAFLARFAASNEAVRRDFFPTRPALFDIDLSAFPQEPDPPPPTGAVLAIAAAAGAEAFAAPLRDAIRRARQALERDPGTTP